MKKLQYAYLAKPQRSGLDVGRNSLRSPQRRSSALVTSITPRLDPRLWNRIKSLPSISKCLISLHILVYALSSCAVSDPICLNKSVIRTELTLHQVALNIVLFSFFRQLTNPIFRHVTPIFGFASWAWLLLVIEPLVCLRYLNFTLGFGNLSSFLGLISRRVWLILRFLSWLVCAANTMLVVVASSSVSFAK